MTEKKKVELGDKVRDRISGFIGIAMIRTVSPYMVDRFSILSQGKAGENQIGDSYDIDENVLEVLEPQVVSAPTEWPEVPFKFDDILKDRITEVEGALMSLAYHLNGCVFGGILPKREKKDGLFSNERSKVEAYHIARLVVVKPAIAPSAAEVPMKKTGPMLTRSERIDL